MKLARFLGLKDEKGNLVEEGCSYQVGDTLRVFPRFEGYVGDYPWADRPYNKDRYSIGLCVFRENELEILGDEEVNLNDYL